MFFFNVDLRFCMAVVMHQRDTAGADVSAAAAFYTIEQAIFPGLVEIRGFGEPVQLLGQQLGRADIHAFAAADAGHLRLDRGIFFDEDAVGGLNHRHVGAGNAQAGHGATDDHLVILTVLITAGSEAILHRCADQDLQVYGVIHFSGHRDVARDDGLAAGDGPIYRGSRGNVVDDYADVNRQALAGDFLAGQCFYKLILAAGRKTGGHFDQFQVIINQAGQGVVCQVHVILDGDHAMPGLYRMTDHARTGHDVGGLFLDQPIVAADMRFTFNAVYD